MNQEQIIRGYAEAADAGFIARYEALDPEAIYAPVADHLPGEPAHILDIGAGTGRDAAWLADLGHTVVAAEPVAPLREAAERLHAHSGLTILDDRLPELEGAARLGPFDWVLCCAVWQHISDPERAESIGRIALLLAPDGRFIVSLRHGPGGEGRPVFPVDPERTVAEAEAGGLSLLHRVSAPAVQKGNAALGVSWTWLVLERPA